MSDYGVYNLLPICDDRIRDAVNYNKRFFCQNADVRLLKPSLCCVCFSGQSHSSLSDTKIIIRNVLMIGCRVVRKYSFLINTGNAMCKKTKLVWK